MLHSIQSVAQLTGITSRTLRHYDDIGLLNPSSTEPGGRRFYDDAALIRLQRILVLRELGVGTAAIAQALTQGSNDLEALEHHVVQLRTEHARLAELITTVNTTIDTLRTGNPLMTETMFDGFNHADHEAEVRERWGDAAWERSDRWWTEVQPGDQQTFMQRHSDLQDAWDAAITEGLQPGDPQVQAIADRHVEWIAAGWQGARPDRAALTGLAEMYVADPRFAANYTRSYPHGAAYVRDALLISAKQL